MNNILKVMLIVAVCFGVIIFFSIKASEYQAKEEIKILETKKENTLKKIEIEINKYLVLRKKLGLEKSEINILNKLECLQFEINNCKNTKELEKIINEL